MRIRDGENPLDGTGVHPESYEAAKGLLQKQGYSPEDVAAHNLAGLSLTIKDYKATAEELGIGEITLRDIVKELESLRATRVTRCQNRFLERTYWK